jgi:hypothetical protein
MPYSVSTMPGDGDLPEAYLHDCLTPAVDTRAALRFEGGNCVRATAS